MGQDIKNILVVDDDTEVAEMIARVLSRFGYQMVITFNMEDGLSAFLTGRFSLVIADIFMKGMGGIEGIRQIKEMDPGIDIIAISGGYAEMNPVEALRAAEKLGVAKVLPKPFVIDDLREMVSEILGT